MIHDSILDTIGHTPVVRLRRMAPAGVELYAKVEAFNPGGSVKDRLALATPWSRPLPATPASPWRWSAPRADTPSSR